jgi:hypothetical protein
LSAGQLAKRFADRKVTALVGAVLRESNGSVTIQSAKAFVLAHLEWMHVLAVRQKIFRGKIRDQGISANGHHAMALSLLSSDPELAVFSRYERRAYNRRRRATLNLSPQ